MDSILSTHFTPEHRHGGTSMHPASVLCEFTYIDISLGSGYVAARDINHKVEQSHLRVVRPGSSIAMCDHEPSGAIHGTLVSPSSNDINT